MREEARKKREAEENSALERATQLEAEGKIEEAQEALTAVPEKDELIIVPQAPPPRAEGVYVREHWKFRVIDKAAVPEQYKLVDEQKVGAIVRAMKDGHGIPGIEAYREEIIAARRER